MFKNIHILYTFLKAKRQQVTKYRLFKYNDKILARAHELFNNPKVFDLVGLSLHWINCFDNDPLRLKEIFNYSQSFIIAFKYTLKADSTLEERIYIDNCMRFKSVG